MEETKQPRQPDSVLLPFLRATGAAESECLENLMRERVEPVIKGIIRQKMRVNLNRQWGSTQSQDELDAEDVHGEAVLQVLIRLSALKSQPDNEVISNFRGYVAVTTYRAYDQYLRDKYPKRWRLKYQTNYLLDNRTNQTGFAVWEWERERFCGFAVWRDAPDYQFLMRKAVERGGRLRQMLDDPKSFTRTVLSGEHVQRMNRADLMSAIFNYLRHPIELDDLVNMLAELLDIRDEPPITETSQPQKGDEHGSHVPE
jgi:hypothetical protein